MITKEREGGTDHLAKPWGFHGPTILIESQSAPVLLGDQAEQAYMRAFVLAGGQDLVVTDFPLNQAYLKRYLKETLGFDLPSFIVAPRKDGSCLSDNVVASFETQLRIKEWVDARGDGYRIQFFNVTDRERILADQLGFLSSSGNIEQAIAIGSKPGFRRFCWQTGLPIPKGRICQTSLATIEALDDILNEAPLALIKAENGTGGNDLVSNIVVSAEEYLGLTSDQKRDLVSLKLDFFGQLIGQEWVVEEFIEGEEGSVHVYIHDQSRAEKPFIIGALSENTSYVGGFGPLVLDEEKRRMVELIERVAVPQLQKRGLFGYHCFDFKDGLFLEDNVRQGALDFINGMVSRIASIHFPGQPHAFWHYHLPVDGVLSFDRIWDVFSQELDPRNGRENNCFMMVTNPEVLPFGRSLDLTAVSFGSESSVEEARQHFAREGAKLIQRLSL